MIFFRESIELFQKLAEIFSNENNQIASREVLMKVCLPGKISVANWVYPHKIKYYYYYIYYYCDVIVALLDIQYNILSHIYK